MEKASCEADLGGCCGKLDGSLSCGAEKVATDWFGVCSCLGGRVCSENPTPGCKIWVSKLRRVREVASAGARAEARRGMAIRGDWATELHVVAVLDGFSDWYSTRRFRAISAPIAAGGRDTWRGFLGVANAEGSERTVSLVNEMGSAERSRALGFEWLDHGRCGVIVGRRV